MSSAVWIATCTHGLRANLNIVPWGDLDAINKVRADLVPCASRRQKGGCWPDWLHEQAQEAGHDLSAVVNGHRSGDVRYYIVGLARLTSRGLTLHRGPLTSPDREGRLLLDVYRDPLDSVLLKVVDSVDLVEPIPVKLRRRQGKTSGERRHLFLFYFIIMSIFDVL